MKKLFAAASAVVMTTFVLTGAAGTPSRSVASGQVAPSAAVAADTIANSLASHRDDGHNHGHGKCHARSGHGWGHGNEWRHGRGHHRDRGCAKNVILLVGDGMGTAQRDAIRLSKTGLKGELVMDSLPVAGRVHTNSADRDTFVTDSAAAATAMASGVKTYNGAIGMNLDREPVTTALEVAEKRGMATGLVTTSQVTDATPAAFGSHVLDRDAQSKIARQFLTSSHPEVILGGGEDVWYPEGTEGKYPDRPAADPSEESHGTEGNLVALAKTQGYEYVWNSEGLEEAGGPKLLGLFANEEMFQYGDDVDEVYEPTVPLTEMTSKALKVLSDDGDDGEDNRSRHDRGFFLLVEEEGIDAMSHANNAELTIESGIEFDKSVAVAKKFAKKHGDTLVIVVGDHQTGGMTIEEVAGDDESGDGASAEDGPLPVADSDQQFTVDWTTGGHAAVDVPLTAMGPGASRLMGVYENTHIHDVMVRAILGR